MRYRFDDYEFDQGSAQLSGPQGVIALRPMTLKLLQALLESAPDVVATDELLDRVWGRQAVVPGVVAQSIAELRKALEDSAQTPRYIETRHRLGYRFVATLQRIEGSQPHAVNAGAAQAPSSPRRRWLKWAVWLVLPVLLLSYAVLRAPGPGDEVPGFYPIDILQAGTPVDGEARQWFRQSLAALRERQLDRAIELLERALAREPDSPATLATLAAVQAEHGQLRRAQSLVDAALQAGRGLDRTEVLRLEGLDAALHLRWDEAIERYQAVFSLDPGDVLAGLALLRAQLAAGRSENARRTLEELAALPQALLEPAQLALARARLASLRGDGEARRQHAEAALSTAADARSRFEAQLELSAALIALGEMSAARSQLDTLSGSLRAEAWPAGEIRWQMLQGQWQRESGQAVAAIEHYAQAAALADGLGDARSADAARRESAYAQQLTGELDEALAAVDGALANQRQRGDLREAAASLNVRGVTLQRAGKIAEAAQSTEEALALYQQVGDAAGQAAARNNLGMLYARSGRSDEALQQFEAAQGSFATIGNRRGAAVALGNVAALHGRAGRAAAAREANEAALAEFVAVGAQLDAARLHFNLALQDRRNGRLTAAEAGLRQALAGFQVTQAAIPRWVATASLADLLLRRAELQQAAALLQPALAETELPAEQRASLLSVAGRLALLRGEREAAGEHFRAALSLRQQAGLTAWARMSELDLAELLAIQGSVTEAESALRVLRRAMLDDGETLDAAYAGGLLAALLQAQRRADEATQLLAELEPLANADSDLALRLDLIRANGHADRQAALAAVATRARTSGFERLALTAEWLAEGQTEVLANTIRGRGIDPGSMNIPW